MTGTYKRTDDETMINVGLDINGTKHLDGYIGYQRKPYSHGFVYMPKLDVRVNDEKIVELSGKYSNIYFIYFSNLLLKNLVCFF